MVYLAAALQLELVVTLLVIAFYRSLAHCRPPRSRRRFESFALLLHYSVGQEAFGLLLVHGFPRLVAAAHPVAAR